MKKLFLTLISLLCTALLLNAQEPVRITILHTNDFHSHLQGYAPESAYTPGVRDNDPTVGGLSRIAGLIHRIKDEKPSSTLVLDAGDFLMGTLFHAMEQSTGFQLPLMKKAGYDFVNLGNHEFDYGPASLAEIIQKSASNGDIPQILSGNSVTSADDLADDAFEALFKSGLVKPYVITEKGGAKIGIFSVLGKDADESAPYAPPVTFEKITKAAAAIVSTLQKEGCQVIICISHSGVIKEKDGQWGGEDVELAKKVKGINIIISGHTHTLLKEPVVVNGVPIVQTGSGGMNVGRADLLVRGNNVSLEKYQMIPVNDGVEADPSIQEAIEKQKKVLDEKILKPLNLSYDMPVVSNSFPLTCEEYGDLSVSNLGPLVADAIYYYVNSEGPGTDIAMVAAGVIRDPLIPGKQSVADLFRVMSLGSGNDIVPGYPLSQVFVTGKELKSIAEILIMSAASTPSHYCYYSHLRIEYDPEGGLFKKVKKMELTDQNGKVIEVSTSKEDKKLYSIVANSYMLDFVGIIKKKSFGLINVVPRAKDGTTLSNMDNAVMDFNAGMQGVQEGKEWLALVKYLQHTGGGSDKVAEMPDYYRKPAQSLVTVSSK